MDTIAVLFGGGYGSDHKQRLTGLLTAVGGKGGLRLAQSSGRRYGFPLGGAGTVGTLSLTDDGKLCATTTAGLFMIGE
jgi:hypothetical protein